MKNKTIPFLFSLFLLASCGAPKECETHDFGEFTVTKEATCGVAGSKERTCTVCGEKDVQVIDALTHNYVDAADQAGAVTATCAVKGKVITECTNCHEKSFREVDKLTTHNFVDAADQAGAKPATCKETGTVITECSVCHEKSTRVVEKLTTHTYGNYVEKTPATHSAEGSKEATCSVCGKKDTQPIAKLAAHEFGTTPTHVDADHDAIAYDVYSCAADNVKRIEWDANDVSADTKLNDGSFVAKDGTTVNYNNYVTSNGGVKFGGRPVNNAVKNPNNRDHTPVLNENVKGSFIEYVVNVKSAIEGATLSAKMAPSRDLQANDTIFASKEGNDWTPGLIADSTAESGYKITPFKYILEVNGNVVEFDANKDTLAGSKENKWYDFPCTVDLQEGANKIKLIQAGGYEATFYNFAITSSTAVTDVVPVNEGYAITFTKDEHVKSVKVYEDRTCATEVEGPTFYSRNKYGRKVKDSSAEITFEVELDEGYQVADIVGDPADAIDNVRGYEYTNSYSVFRVEDITGDVALNITTESTETVHEGFHITFEAGEHISRIEVYNSKIYREDLMVTGLVATSLDETFLRPTKVDGQIYFKVFCEEGYVIDIATTEAQLGKKPYKNFKTIADNCYRLTKVSKDGTVKILAKAA